MRKFTKMWAAALCALFAGTVQAEDYVWKYVTTGDATTLAIRSDGSLWSWGWNELGQAANGVKERTAVPTLADASRVWKKAVSGKGYTFALAEDGSLWATGSNESGVQGTGDGMAHKTLTRIGTDNDWADMACCRFWCYSGFGIKTNGTLWAWGANSSGQLGIGTTQVQTTPVQVGTDTDWKQVAAGASSVLAVKTDGTLWAWADNSLNLLGFNSGTQGETTSEGNPVEVVTEGKVAEPRQVTAIEGNVLVVSGCENTLSVGTGKDGIIDQVWMLGSNTDGALGDGNGLGNGSKDIPFATVPVHPSLRSSLQFAGMSSGQNYTMMLTTDGDIWGWGCNRGGQLGDETRPDQLQVAYEVKPTLINCPQDEVGLSVADVKGKAAATVAFDGQVLSIQADGRLTSAVVYGMDGQAVMILPVSASSWDVSALASGVYVARFVVDGAAVTYKFAAE